MKLVIIYQGINVYEYLELISLELYDGIYYIKYLGGDGKTEHEDKLKLKDVEIQRIEKN